MPEQTDLDRRLRAVERALTDGDHDVAALQDAAATADELTALEERITTLEERIAELDAATQAVRGYVGNVRSVNQEVEERADAALAAVDRIERRLNNRTESGGDRNFDRNTTLSRRSSEQSGRRDGTESANLGTLAGEEKEAYGIEMPPPGSASGSEQEVDDADERRSVIERVREAL